MKNSRKWIEADFWGSSTQWVLAGWTRGPKKWTVKWGQAHYHQRFSQEESCRFHRCVICLRERIRVLLESQENFRVTRMLPSGTYQFFIVSPSSPFSILFFQNGKEKKKGKGKQRIEGRKKGREGRREGGKEKKENPATPMHIQELPFDFPLQRWLLPSPCSLTCWAMRHLRSNSKRKTLALLTRHTVASGVLLGDLWPG